MIHKYLLLYLLFASSSLTCFTNHDLSTKKVKEKQQEFEGFVILDVKTVIDVDGSGLLLKPVSGNDSIMLSSQRKMYLKGNYLIDIIGSIKFHDGTYFKTDTLSYDFYDLVNQKYILFDKLSTDAKIIKRGSMEVNGSFSIAARYDPMNEVVDSIWKVADTVVSGKRQGVINFNVMGITDSLEREYAKRAKFWVDYETKSFPLQLSYILSKKLGGGFVYKMQNPFPDGKTVMISTLDYQPAKLPDTLTRIIESWKQLARE